MPEEDTDRVAAPVAASAAGGAGGHHLADAAETQVDDARDALEEARRRLAEVPAQVVVVNHMMGLYELAAIHLSATPPDLPGAALAIDALACLLDGVGDRIGDDATTLRDALANIRLAFVQITGQA